MKLLRCTCGVVAILLVGITATAQQESTSKPMAPIAPVSAVSGQSADNTPVPTDETAPDTHALSGAQLLTLGTAEGGLNTLTPAFHIGQSFDTHSTLHDQTIGTQGISSFGGSLALNRTTGKQTLKLHYNGGAVIYSDSTNLNSSYHQFGISESAQLGRWNLVFSDDASYAPESPLNGTAGAYGGFGGFGDLAGLGLAGLSGLSPGFLPNQSIYTLNSSRVSNTAMGQVGYNFSGRTTATASFGYGLLRFLSADLLDSSQWMFTSGISHSFNAHDSIAVNYNGAIFSYSNIAGQIRTHSVQVSYARRLTGRLSWQVAGGPQIYTSDFSGVSITNVIPAGSTSLQYSRGHNSVNVGFSAGVGSGAGVFVGAKTYNTTAGLTREWTRNWTTNTSVGYSRNDALTAASNYDSAFAGMQVSRALGRSASLYVSYAWQRQIGSAAPIFAVANSNFARNLIGFGFDWHFRPIRLAR